MARAVLSGLLPEIRAMLPEIVALRRHFHRWPEIGLSLPQTQERVLSSLSALNLKVSAGPGRLTYVVADLDGHSGDRTILLRSDMDALPIEEESDLPFASQRPRAMHACGHDAHMAMLVGAAHILARHRSELAGRVRFTFQPGEEADFGSRQMIEAGVLEGVDAAFAIHVTPNLPSASIGLRAGIMMAAADTFSITIRGSGGHASLPQASADPIAPACEIATALQGLISRELGPFEPAALNVCRLNAGDATNAIPSTAELSGTVRSLNPSARKAMLLGIARIAEATASAHKCAAIVRFGEGYPATMNATAAANVVKAAAAGIVAPSQVITLPKPSLGADDFGFVLERVPGAMTFLGACPPEVRNPANAAPVHSPRFRLDEDAMVTGIALHVATVFAFFKDISLVASEAMRPTVS